MDPIAISSESFLFTSKRPIKAKFHRVSDNDETIIFDVKRDDLIPHGETVRICMSTNGKFLIMNDIFSYMNTRQRFMKEIETSENITLLLENAENGHFTGKIQIDGKDFDEWMKTKDIKRPVPAPTSTAVEKMGHEQLFNMLAD